MKVDDLKEEAKRLGSEAVAIFHGIPLYFPSLKTAKETLAGHPSAKILKLE